MRATVDFVLDKPPIQYRLSVSLTGTGKGHVTGTGISCPTTCSHSYPAGTHITLAAKPAAGSTFAGWTGGACSGTGACRAGLTSTKRVTAKFTEHA
jgi:hypothetical protein